MLTAGLLASLTASALVTVQPKPGDDLQGRWKLVSVQTYDPNLDKKGYTPFALVVKGDKMTWEYDRESFKQEGTYKLPPTDGKGPKAIDLSSGSGGKKFERVGIYAVEGDKLKICFDTVDPADPKRRPTDFTTPEGSGRVLLVFERVKE
jgi:uncharacterized protein (TIGR03067 family)